MPSQQKLRASLLGFAATAAIALAALALGVPAAFGADAHYEGISEDGGVAVFSTTDKLVAGDTDTQRDVYVRDFEEGFGYVTREASLGPSGGNDAFAAQFLAIDPAGERVFFSTGERLTAADKDTATDIYVRDLESNTTTLVSAGSASCAASGCGNGDVDAGAVADGVVDGGNEVFFVSSEKLSPQDGDESADVYLRDLEAGTTTLVSAGGSPCSGTCGSGPKAAFFQGASADGTKAIFTTAESLVSADTDSEADLYERNLTSGETKLVSTPGPGPGACPAGHNCEPSNSGISADGSHVFFETNEMIVAGDGDDAQDVYDWSAGIASLVSTGPSGGDGTANALFEGSSADGSEVFFATGEKLLPADTDAVQDIYVRRGGTSTELVSAGDPSCSGLPANCGNGPSPALLQWIAADGSVAVLSTAESLTSEDGDSKADVYSRALPGGPTSLVSRPGPTCTDPACGDGNHNASFSGASADGSHLFFVTAEALAPPALGDTTGPGDRDERTDAYERSGGLTSLVSAGQLTGSGPYSGNGAFDAQLQGASADGSSTFLVTKEQLTAEDSDTGEDVYMRSGGGTLLVSRANDAELEAELAPPGPVLKRTDPESPNAATSIRVIGQEPVEGATIKLYSSPNCTGQPVATGTAAQLEEPGIAVTVGVESGTKFHAIAEAEGFVSPCSGEVFYRQEPEESFEGEEEEPRPRTSPSVPIGLISIPHEVPQTRITFGPAFKTRVHRPVFRFTDATGQQDTTFICKLDRAAWRPCSSPLKLPKVALGKHLLRVKAVNAIGVWEAKPTKREFKVVAS
jgi:hypothetical protein